MSIIERLKLIWGLAKYRAEQYDPPEPKTLEERELELWDEFVGELEDELGVERGFFDEVPRPPERRSSDNLPNEE